MTELPPPGDYWLVTKSGGTKRAVVADELTLLIRQGSDWNGNEWLGDRWWQPPIELIEEAGWTFVPRVS